MNRRKITVYMCALTGIWTAECFAGPYQETLPDKGEVDPLRERQSLSVKERTLLALRLQKELHERYELFERALVGAHEAARLNNEHEFATTMVRSLAESKEERVTAQLLMINKLLQGKEPPYGDILGRQEDVVGSMRKVQYKLAGRNELELIRLERRAGSRIAGRLSIIVAGQEVILDAVANGGDTELLASRQHAVSREIQDVVFGGGGSGLVRQLASEGSRFRVLQMKVASSTRRAADELREGERSRALVLQRQAKATLGEMKELLDRKIHGLTGDLFPFRVQTSYERLWVIVRLQLELQEMISEQIGGDPKGEGRSVGDAKAAQQEIVLVMEKMMGTIKRDQRFALLASAMADALVGARNAFDGFKNVRITNSDLVRSAAVSEELEKCNAILLKLIDDAKSQ